MAEADNVSIAIVGSGGAGALTTGNLLLEAAAAAGWYGLLNRTVGPQIRGGEAAALIRLAAHPIECLSDQFDLLIAVDWLNADRFDAEIPLGPHSLVVGDPRGGDVPANITVSGARLMEIPFKDLAKAIPEGRANMIALGVAAKLLGLGEEALSALIEKRLKEKGASAIAASRTAIKAGISAAADIDLGMRLAMPKADTRKRWLVSGNEATGLGAIRGGVRFTAAYPITPNGRPTLPRPCRARPSCFPTNSWDNAGRGRAPGRRRIHRSARQGDRIVGPYKRYALAANGVSPMAVPGTPGGQYTADGLTHTERGLPSSRAEDHGAQLDKRRDKLNCFNYGDHWATVEGKAISPSSPGVRSRAPPARRSHWPAAAVSKPGSSRHDCSCRSKRKHSMPH